jgi:ADP-glucose pyrophosphorylase
LNRLELVDATFKTIFDLNNLDFIECSMNSGRYNSCNFISSELVNGTIHGGEITDSDIFNSKVENARIDRESEIEDCYLYQCLIDGSVKGNSVLRMCKIGPNAVIEDSVRIVTDTNNYFNTSSKVNKKGGPSDGDIKDMKIPQTKGKKW